MLSLPPNVRVFVALDAIDMRGSFDSLAGRVRTMGLDPLDGHLYVFFNRRRRLVKVLFFDATAFCIFQKRLERGTFELPPVAEHGDRVTVDGPALASLLAGIDLRAPRRRWYARTPSPGR